MSTAQPPPPPPPPPGGAPPPPPPAYRPVPPPLPAVDPALIRPTTRWYWLAGAIVGISIIVSTVISFTNTFENFGDDPDPGLSLLSYALYVGGVGIAAIVGGITWSRREAHRRSLQQEARRQHQAQP